MRKRMKIYLSAPLVFASCLPFAACGGEAETEAAAVSVQRALVACTFGTPAVTEVREESPGPVAPGIAKIYFVTIRNGAGAGCDPATLIVVPDSFHLFNIVAQPGSAGGVAPGATATFRVTVTSDPSVAVGTYPLGFTAVADPGGNSARGSLVYQVSLDNPVGCNRQRPAIAIDNPDPPAVPAQTAVVYHVTVRNVDNRECGPDTLHLSPFSLHFVSVVASGPFNIAPQGSAVFDLTIQASDLFGPGSVITEPFDLLGDRHQGVDLRSTGTVTYRVR